MSKETASQEMAQCRTSCRKERHQLLSQILCRSALATFVMNAGLPAHSQHPSIFICFANCVCLSVWSSGRLWDWCSVARHLHRCFADRCSQLVVLASRSQLAHQSLASLLKVSCWPLANHSQIVSNSHPNFSSEGRKSAPGRTKIHPRGVKNPPKIAPRGPAAPKKKKFPESFPFRAPKNAPRAA